VEAARLGQMTDYEKLALEVWTNGAITPQDAIGLASKLVKDHMSIFINFEEQPDLPEGSGRVLQRSARRALGSFRRGTRTLRPFLQLPEKREHPVHPRTGPEERERDAEDQKLRPQIAQRDQGNPDQNGPESGHEVRRARTHHLAAAPEPDGATHIGGNRGPLSAAKNPLMRHRNYGSKLGRQPAHRRATLRNLVTNVIERSVLPLRSHAPGLRSRSSSR